jgi:hypothetical protein
MVIENYITGESTAFYRCHGAGLAYIGASYDATDREGVVVAGNGSRILAVLEDRCIVGAGIASDSTND